jgi:hypothetical protein
MDAAKKARVLAEQQRLAEETKLNETIEKAKKFLADDLFRAADKKPIEETSNTTKTAAVETYLLVDAQTMDSAKFKNYLAEQEKKGYVFAGSVTVADKKAPQWLFRKKEDSKPWGKDFAEMEKWLGLYYGNKDNIKYLKPEVKLRVPTNNPATNKAKLEEEFRKLEAELKQKQSELEKLSKAAAEADAKDGKTQVLTLSLKNTKAEEVAKIIRQVYTEKECTVAVDQRTNSLIVKLNPDIKAEFFLELIKRLDSKAAPGK